MGFRLTVNSSRNHAVFKHMVGSKCRSTAKREKKSLASLQSFHINQKLEILIFIEICIYVGKISHSAPSWRHLAV
jgi:hypothetical protein